MERQAVRKTLMIKLPLKTLFIPCQLLSEENEEISLITTLSSPNLPKVAKTNIIVVARKNIPTSLTPSILAM